MRDELHIGRFVAALTAQGRVRVMAVVVDGPADVLRERHDLQADGGRLAAEALVASLLLAAHIKGEERLTVDIQAENPRFAIVIDVNADGTVRGRLRPPDVVCAGSFSGLLSVGKSLGRKELYRGVSEIRGESLERALNRYLLDSQQTDARVRVRAELDDDGHVVFAAGLLVERLPDMPADDFAAQFDGALAGDFRELMTAFAFGQIAGETVEVLGARDIHFSCPCSAERVGAMLRTLGREEVSTILAEQGRAEVICHFCNEVYEFDGAALEAMLTELADA